MEIYIDQANGIIRSYLGPEWDIGLLISKAIGYAIVFFSLILKVPQIQKLVSSKDPTGISRLSIVVETVGFTISMLAGWLLQYPFSTYGESVFIWIQNLIIVYLVFSYAKKINAVFFIGVLVYIISVVAVVQLHNKELVQNLQNLNIGIFIFSKIPQIVSVYKLKSVGQLSFVTSFLNLGGSLARVFTTLKEVNDFSVLAGFLTGATLNTIIVIQFLLYWNNKVPTRKVVSSDNKKKIR
ncbi:transmembrane protein [Cavenderia fasciculata]|uniref:Mannose-P-dolichol utilization defect 1 protein homolog n=1 Tax=Cavenderia fasciculata TaxID=261658 RepID=F4PQN0_CACFS|nr:uncharacterized protein DFA_01072 [Cavenderia fasciculata]EGG21197.1 transmembrane protein [Cavenderia fasciculata]|eukprot:XP_004359047.1 transmembrane protein [Cavenderia fasciculata]